MLEKFYLDQTSFWLGFTAALILWWLIKRARPIISSSREALAKESGKYQNKFSSSIEHRYRKDILSIVQENHLAAPLFSLTEVAIEPRLMAPPYPVVPDGPIPPEDSTDLVIPFMPDWPEMAASYGLQTLSLSEALSSGQNLAFIGKPGIGKSFALNYLCAQVARRDPELGELRKLVPLLIHASDLELSGNSGDLLNVFYKVLADKVSTIVESQFPKFLKNIFKNNTVLLMVDGFDELPKSSQKPIIEFLGDLRKTYPDFRVVMSLLTEDLSCVGPLGLFPIPIAAWNNEQSQEFFNRWEDLWTQFVVNETWAEKLPDLIDPMILNNWLKKDKVLHTPLEMTLKTWAIYAGDVVGPSISDSIEAYVNRMSGAIKNSVPAMKQIAIQMVLTSNPQITRKSAGKFVSKYEENVPAPELETLPETSNDNNIDDNPFLDDDLRKLLEGIDEEKELPEESVEIEVNKKNKKPKQIKVKNSMRSAAVRRMLPELVSCQLMKPRSDNTISFNHSMILGYLAGSGFAEREDVKKLISDSKWSGLSMTLNFLAGKSDMSSLVPLILEKDKDDPLNPGMQMMSHWMIQTTSSPPWLQSLLRAFVGILRNEHLPLGYRGRVLTALACSGQPGVDALFRQLMKEDRPSVKILGALGSGIIQDHQAIEELRTLLNTSNITGCRAACMALIAIDSDRSLELVGEVLLNANEEGRRAAAEALARHPREGYEFLRDGSKMEDLSVRRAVVYGLTWVDDSWAKEILSEMHLNDEQWVVRNAAANALESELQKTPRIPSMTQEVSNLPWLMNFAGEQGMGLSPGQAGWDMLALAIREGNEEQILGAMDILRIHPFKARAAVADIYKISEGPGGEVKEAAYTTLWHLAAMGVDIGGYL